VKQRIQLAAGVLSLIALLTYTLIHTGGLLARYVNPPFAGYVAALGIETAIVSLSLRIGDLRKSNLDYRFFGFVLVAVVVVSALANVYEGFHTYYGEPMTAANLTRLDPIQAIVGLSATGLISLIVLALSEIIGTDAQAVAKQMTRDRRKNTPQPANDPVSDQTTEQKMDLLDQANEVRQSRIMTRRATVLELRNDGLSQTEIANRLNVSPSTVKRDLQTLNGSVTK